MRPIDAAEAGQAPRILAGWQAAQAVLADGQWHGHHELLAAITATGLAERTARNILDDARRGRLDTQRFYRQPPAAPLDLPDF